MGYVFNSNIFSVKAVKIDRFHGYKVDNAVQVRFKAHRDLHGHRIVAQLFLQLADDTWRVGATAIAFIDERDTRHFVALHLLIDGNGLGLNTADGAQNQNSAIQYP